MRLLIPAILLACLGTYFTLSPTLLAEKSPPAPVKKALIPGEPSDEDLGRARKLLHTWENELPEKSPRVMRICYWSPVDRDPQPDYRPRLTRVMKHIQEFYRREMESWGFPGRSIQLELEQDGMLKLHTVKGRLKSDECSETDQKDGQEIRRDCIRQLHTAGINGEKETLVIFCNLADWDPEKRTMGHHSPYYAGGDSRSGTAWQVDSPLLDSDLLAVKDQHIQDRQYGRISLGKYNSIFVGGVCHELGHALGLPHCKECPTVRKTRGTALMGSGNRTYGDELRGDGLGSFLTLPHALKLAAHPQFSGSVKQMETKVKADFADWKLTPVAEGLNVSGRVAANLPLHAVLAYADPAGGADYDSEIAAAIPTADGSFSLQLPKPEKKNTTANLHFVAVAANGTATAGVWSAQAFTMACRITEDSSYDVSRAMEKMALNRHLEEFLAGKLTDAQMGTLSPRLQSVLRRLKLQDSADGKPTPAAAADSVKELFLSDAAPTTAKTGWGGVHYDRNAEGKPLVGPEGIMAHGLYAHADSTYEYDLGGKWGTITGTACLMESGYGPIEATILGDGKPLWHSKTIKSGEAKTFQIELKGIQKLTLSISGKDGKNGAWGAWAEPVLRR